MSPDLEVMNTEMVRNATLYRSVRPELLIRIFH